MKFLSKHILVTSFACLLFSWRVNTSSQSGSEIVKSEPKKGGMQPDEDEMGVDDCPNKNEAESLKKHLEDCPFSYYSNDGRTFLSSERKLSDDFERLRGSEHFQTIEKANVKDLLNQITSISSNNQNRFDIHHPNIDEFVKESVKLFEKMEYGSIVSIKGDLSTSAFDDFCSKMIELRKVKEEICKNIVVFPSDMNLFSSLENQNKAKEVMQMQKDKLFFESAEVFCKLSMTLIREWASHTVESVKGDNREYNALSIFIDGSGDLAVLFAAITKYPIVKLKINFDYDFKKFFELHEIIKSTNLTYLYLFGFCRQSAELDNFLMNCVSRASYWKNLKELKLRYFSFQAIFEAFKNQPLKLENIVLSDCFDPSKGWKALSQEQKVLSVQNLRIALDKGNLSKDAAEYLLGIFPNAKRVLISAGGEVARFEVKSNNLEKLQILAKSIENEQEFMVELAKTKLPFISAKTVTSDSINWVKVGDRIFYNTRFENLISPENLEKQKSEKLKKLKTEIN